MRTYTEVEQEIVVLKVVWDLIHEMVNFSMFRKFEESREAQLMPSSKAHQRLFNILLVDFLSRPASVFDLPQPPKTLPVSEQGYLFHLKRICASPKLNPAGSEVLLSPLMAFADWLESECFIENVWLPSIQVQTNLTLKRVVFIKICGNIAKHSTAF